MLYDPHLDIFLKAAEAGSFSKAASEMFITPSAVIKQINLFEKDLGVKLFERSARGLQLTAAGRSLQRDAAEVVTVCNQAVSRARETMLERGDIVRIGTSPITQVESFGRVWDSILKLEPTLRYQLIPFDNSKTAASRILPNLGNTIDVVFGITDRRLLEDNGCAGLVAWREPLCIGVPVTDPLADKLLLSIGDLAGKRLFMPHPGFIESIDLLRDFLEKEHPEIQIDDYDIYTVEAFNTAHETGALVLSLQRWSNVHPLIRMVPVDWDYDVPYGLIYSTKPSESVRRFISAIEKSL